jgi:hypothetical protein
MLPDTTSLMLGTVLSAVTMSVARSPLMAVARVLDGTVIV